MAGVDGGVEKVAKAMEVDVRAKVGQGDWGKGLTDTNMCWGSVTGTWMALDREERLSRLAKSVFFFLGGGKGFFFFFF
jgi:hypothetical protein